MSDSDELNEVLKTLRQGKTATPVTIRDFLSWFGVQRRTSANVEYINAKLKKAGIQTVPDYLNIWVDTPITFELTTKNPAPSRGQASETKNAPDSTVSVANDENSTSDPSYRIGKIASANNPPLSVKPNSSLLQATTLMLLRNFSQLPVMTNERDVKGVVSWESIGARYATNVKGSDVHSFMDEHYEIPVTASLFVAIKTIVDHNYVLIRGPEGKISGIVTATDIALQFEEISTPFLRLAEIENSIRSIIEKKLTFDDVRRACSNEHLPTNFSKISDLSFGNYVRILEDKENWEKLCVQLDRATFCSELIKINSIRNDVMHFDPDPLKKEDIAKLRDVARLLERLRNIGAV